MNTFSKQRGAVLFVSLVFLIILALLGIAASSNSILQYKMANGLRDGQMGQFGSESALRAGEVAIFAEAQKSVGISGLPFCGSVGMGAGAACKFDSTNNAHIDPNVIAFRTTTTPCVLSATPPCATPPGASTIATGGSTGGYSSALETILGSAYSNPGYLPQFIIEDLGTDTPSHGMVNLNGTNNSASAAHLFRITARSLGASGNSVRITESVFVAAVNDNNQYQ